MLSFIYSKYMSELIIFSAYCVLQAVLCAGDTAVNQINTVPTLMSLTVLVEETDINLTEVGNF